MDEVERLERLSAIADARLGVAEELGWFIASLLAVIVYLKMDSSWLAALVAFVGSYYVATYGYRRNAAKAEDAYFRAGDLGKYSRSR